LINLAIVIGSIIWGKIIDITKWRVEIIYICSIGIAFASLSLLLYPHFIIIIMIVSLMIGIFSIGIEPTTNVIIKERAHGKSNEIIHIFTWTSFIISIGFAFAMVLGYLILIFYDVRYYALVCFFLGSFSLGMSILWTREKFLKINKSSISTILILPFQLLKQFYILSFFLKVNSMLFQLFKSANDFPFLIHAYKINHLLLGFIRYKESKFFICILMYYISSSLMFTPITPFLKIYEISDSQIFIAFIILNLSRSFYLPFNQKVVYKSGGNITTAKISYIPRLIGIIIIISVTIFAFDSNGVLIMTFLAFATSIIGFIIWNTTTTSAFLESIPFEKSGYMAGLLGTMTGLGLLIGSALSGPLSQYFGYVVSFSMSLIFLLFSFVLLRKYFNYIK
jgi:MFS family permease